MSTTASLSDSSAEKRSFFDRYPMTPWMLALLGYLAAYLPVFWDASQELWNTEEYGHGPIILAVLAWLFWSKRKEIFALELHGSGWGWLALGLGILVYSAGRIFEISIFEMGSQMLVVAGIFLLLSGLTGLKLIWFPILYFIFLIPLPGPFVDAVTGPLKSWISVIVVEILHWVGYPIGRTGVAITVGQYQMLVADACSGLHSMFSLSALGTLFMYIMARRSVAHNVIMMLSILPIAFIANIIRVIILILVTYHMGDEAGQGFLHGFAGMVLMLAALVSFFMLDALLSLIFRERSHSTSEERSI
jgi:exosortase B